MIKLGENMEEKTSLKKGIHKMILFFLVLTLIVIAILFYSRYVETKKLKVNERVIVNDKFKGKLHGYKIAHISDIHYGKTTGKKELDRLVEKINETKPNILIFSGDLIDKDTILTEKVKEEIELALSKLNPSIIRYVVKGEDDIKRSDFGLIMENAGFISLDDRYECLYLNQTDYILLAGIESIKGETDFDKKLSSVNTFLEEQKENKPIYSIMVMHEPDMVEQIDPTHYDLLLAGHTHGGQVVLPVFGSIVYPKYAKNYNKRYQKIENKDFYISSGIGSTTYGFRLFNPPSFDFYRIVSY